MLSTLKLINFRAVNLHTLYLQVLVHPQPKLNFKTLMLVCLSSANFSPLSTSIYNKAPLFLKFAGDDGCSGSMSKIEF